MTTPQPESPTQLDRVNAILDQFDALEKETFARIEDLERQRDALRAALSHPDQVSQTLEAANLKEEALKL